MSLPEGWTPIGTVQWGTLIALAISFVFGVFVESNVRYFFERIGLDQILWGGFSNVRSLRSYRWAWFVFGILLGGTIIAWTLPKLSTQAPSTIEAVSPPPQSPPADIAKIATLTQERDTARGQLDAKTQEAQRFEQQALATRKELGEVTHRRDDLQQQLSSAQQQISALTSQHAPRFSKSEVLRLQGEVFAIHELLNTTALQLRDPVRELSENGMSIVAANGQEKSVAMLNSYYNTAKALYVIIAQDNPNKLKYDWNEIGPLTDGAQQTIGLFLTILNQYRNVLLRPGDFRSNILEGLLGEQRNIEVTGPEFLKWLDKSIERCEAKKVELQEALQHVVD